MNFRFLLCLLFLCLTSCATTFKAKQFQSAAIGMVAGAAYGSSLNSHKSENAVLYGSIGALAALSAAILYFDPDEKIDEQQEKLKKFEELFPQNSKSENNIFNIRRSSHADFTQLPKGLKNKVTLPGWKIYDLDEWEAISDTEIIHKTEMFKFTPMEIRN